MTWEATNCYCCSQGTLRGSTNKSKKKRKEEWFGNNRAVIVFRQKFTYVSLYLRKRGGGLIVLSVCDMDLR